MTEPGSAALRSPDTGAAVCVASRHDTVDAYNSHRCRCPSARRLHSLDEKRRRLERLEGRPRRVDATGTHRRLRALMAIGWRGRDLAPRIGWSCGELDAVFRRRHVNRVTAEAVARVYADLADRQGPSEQTRRRAARAGWLPPIWWDDDLVDDPAYLPRLFEGADRTRRPKYDIDPVAVERAVKGNPSPLMRRGERLEAVRRLRCDAELGYQEIADLLHVDQRQVHRDLTDLGLVHQEAGAA